MTGAALVVPVVALSAGVARAGQAKTVVTLEAEWRRWNALAQAPETDDQMDALCDECKRCEDLIAATPAGTMGDMAAKLRMAEHFVIEGTDVTALRLIRSLLADVAALA